jgi:hypothetical protein
MKLTLPIFWLILAIFANGAVRAGTLSEAKIGEVLHGMFDKPGGTLTVSPVVISGDFAIADWVQGDMGGRALLWRKQGVWVLTLCAGDGIKSLEALRTAGVPQQDAVLLEQNLAAAEAALGPERVAMFSRFEGLVMMDGPQGHSGDHAKPSR